MEQKRWYKCDPSKNTACKKRTCKYNPNALFPICDRTSNPAYAMCGRDNRPMEVSEESAFQVVREINQFESKEPKGGEQP